MLYYNWNEHSAQTLEANFPGPLLQRLYTYTDTDTHSYTDKDTITDTDTHHHQTSSSPTRQTARRREANCLRSKCMCVGCSHTFTHLYPLTFIHQHSQHRPLLARARTHILTVSQTRAQTHADSHRVIHQHAQIRLHCWIVLLMLFISMSPTSCSGTNSYPQSRIT